MGKITKKPLKNQAFQIRILVDKSTSLDCFKGIVNGIFSSQVSFQSNQSTKNQK